MWFAYATAWLSTSVAVIYAISITGRISPLWALLIPGLIRLSVENNKTEDKVDSDEV